jgi:UDP-2,4-diacetamido-2,4,6-trideoxy-beta-L-altropyranose hydrolase
MRVAFRADASLQIGTGHVMRCLTLADALRARGGDCLFICRSREGHLAEVIRARGYDVVMLQSVESRSGEYITRGSGSRSIYAEWLGTDWETDARQTQEALATTATQVDWLVVDHYSLDANWEQAMRPFCGHLMVIDDLADRMHDCDLLLDQNLGRSSEDYVQLLPVICKILVGPQHAPLRPEFAQLRHESLTRRATHPLRHVLVSMGGVDKDNATGTVMQALKAGDLPDSCQLTIVMGPYAPWLESVRRLAASLPWATRVLVNVPDMARVMADSDLAIGAAGSTSWERCSLGLPTVIVVLAENQWPGALALQAAGGAVLIGDIASIENNLCSRIREARALMTELTARSSQITDGLGTERVIQCMGSLRVY